MAGTSTHTRHSNNGKAPSLRNELADLRETVREGVHGTSESGRRVLKAAGSAAVNAAGGLRSSAARARDSVGGTIAERPFTSVAIAAGVGAVLGAAAMWRRR